MKNTYRREASKPEGLFRKELDEFRKAKVEVKRKHEQYIHLRYTLGWFTLSIFRLGYRFSIRLEIARGWSN